MSAATAPSLVDRVIDGRYRVRAHLADGGMASVYVAVDERLERDVALKIMRPDLARDEEFVSRFRREARAAARLSHPNVVAVYDQGSDGGYVFLAMELVTGRTLRQVLSADGPLTPRAALDVLEPVLQALAAAHRAGIIHRDVKPENVLLGDDGVVKVADFGLARAVTTATRTSHTDVLLGTAAYLSPEQVERGIADARSDVYAAGLLLFEMLTGRKAFPGDSPIHVAYQHVHGTVPTASDLLPLPRELDALIALAAARDPDHRPADAAALLAQLRSSRAVLDPAELDRRPALDGPGDTSARTVAMSSATRALPGAAAPAPPASSTTPKEPRRRRRWPVLVAAVLAVALAAAGGWWFLLGPGAQVTVPTLAGRTGTQAVAALHRAHLDAQVHDVFSEHTRRGRVVRTDPGAREEARRGSTVDVALSKGPQRFEVPALTGNTQQQAAQLLSRRHLALGDVTQRYDEQAPAGEVLASSPDTGTPLRRGTTVSLVVSKGPRPIPVPSVVGKAQDDAVATLKDAGLDAKVGGKKFSDDVPKGAVVSQDPADGSTLHRGDPVTLTLSKGPQLFPVPDVTFKNVDTARQMLQDAGFTVQVKTVWGGVLHVVRLQDPESGTKVPHGTVITLTVI